MEACKDWLPTQVNIAKRKVPVDGICPVCNKHFETTLHSLWGCSGLKLVRTAFRSLRGSNCGNFVGFQDFLNFCSSELTQEELVLLCVILWRNWFLRNKSVHGGGRDEMGSVVDWCKGFVEDFRDVNAVPVVRDQVQISEPIRWKPPREGLYKLKTDAALNGGLLPVGTGLVIRDHAGNLMASSAQKVEATFSPQVAEAMAILRGLHFAVDSEIEVIVCDIKDLKSRIGDVSVVHISRKANVVAHNLSKLSLLISEDLFWMKSYPPTLQVWRGCCFGFG
ncbi:hypothetical protein Dsin_022821 [Dipteronia sinensis]|uniref:RNase H type-1 domain-containing protein n=1 Tax=Dipteronia sinensis TaxID=43782 RepID=A0AAE0E0A0_9ROSI|nr:hypothetical protein Dsin_022821 [Dipteronia sinensis]